jgi:hypothetical protein
MFSVRPKAGGDGYKDRTRQVASLLMGPAHLSLRWTAALPRKQERAKVVIPSAQLSVAGTAQYGYGAAA